MRGEVSFFSERIADFINSYTKKFMLHRFSCKRSLIFFSDSNIASGSTKQNYLRSLFHNQHTDEFSFSLHVIDVRKLMKLPNRLTGKCNGVEFHTHTRIRGVELCFIKMIADLIHPEICFLG